MRLLISYLRLVRSLNLIMIVFTLYMVRLFFLLADSRMNETPPVGDVSYALFSLAFVFMAAGGYVINDYYDIETDKINKPGGGIIGNGISIRSALIAYWALNVLGIVAGFWSCYRAGVVWLAALFFFYFIGLWFYSYRLKGTFLLGNVLVGIFLAFVPLGGACIELYSTGGQAMYSDSERSFILALIGGISTFAFIATFIREIAKDAEDVEGDSLTGCHTIPVVIGIKKTKWLVFCLTVLLNAILGFIQYQCMRLGVYIFIYFLVFIQSLFLVILYGLLKATAANHFYKISTWLKALMFTGTIYVFIVAFYLYNIYLSINLLFK